MVKAEKGDLFFMPHAYRGLVHKLSNAVEVFPHRQGIGSAIVPALLKW